nr:MAG TPA: hypothetical protein [Caudoviricetes sp.]
MIDKELADKIDNQDETAKLAAKLDNKSIVRLASFHSRKPNSISTSIDTVAIPRGAIEELVKLADEAECGSDKDAVMVVGAVKMLRTYLLESRKESSDDAKSE